MSSLTRRLRREITDPPKLSRLDKLIAGVSPTWALSRARSRAALELVMRHYEGGSRTRRTEGWRAPGTDANAAAEGTLETLRNRCRDLARNNSWAGRGVRAMVQSAVGTGIVPSFVTSDGSPIEGSEADKLRATWGLWSGSGRQIDADGVSNFYGLQRLALRTILQSGEALVRRRWRRPEDGLAVPLQVQVLEPDYLDTRMDGDARDENGRPVRRIHGIEFDALGRRRGYWMFREHPGSRFRLDMRSYLVPADEILHLYVLDRPGQVTGVPRLAPAVIRCRDLDELEDAALVKAKVSAMFVGLVRDSSEVENLAAVQAATRTNAAGTPIEEMEPGMFEYLTPGKDITFSDPPDFSGYGEYTAQQLRALAVSLDVTYEQLTGDLRGTSFTSGRMGLNSHYAAVEDWRWDVLCPRLCDELFAWFLLAYELARLPLPADVRPMWTPPGRFQVNPTEETAATKAAVRNGFMSLSEAQRERGYEPAEVRRELAADLAAARAEGLMLDVDPGADSNRKPPDTKGAKDNGGRPDTKVSEPAAKA